MKNKSIFLSFFVLANLIFGTINTHAEDNNLRRIADEAQKAYSEGQYMYAIELYDSILNTGNVSSNLYYNIGNAYFKNNQMSHAIWYYEKAKQLSPSDEQINFNLNLANTLITDRIEAIPQLFYHRWWQALYSMYSADTWGIILIVVFFLFFIMLALYLLAKTIILKKIYFAFSIMFLSVSILIFLLANKQYNVQVKQQTAIVFSPRITAKSAPDENSIDLFVIHEGTKVFITDVVGEWYEIKIASGNVGWLKKSGVREI
ncbi:MAG: hypothetical protein PHT69_05465 [Bacteroidales bacterium]|nr:hypothetical protein [Bacteroidales bacterium]